MKPLTRRTVACLAWSPALLLAAVSAAHAQRSGAGPCRQGLLAMIVMIDADEHDKSHYRSTAKSVVETCGPPAAAKKTAAAPPAAFDRDLCGKLALAMLDSIEDGKLESPQFAHARDEFAGKCLGGALRKPIPRTYRSPYLGPGLNSSLARATFPRIAAEAQGARPRACCPGDPPPCASFSTMNRAKNR